MPVDLNALFAPAAIAFVISATVIWALLRSRVSTLALDRPNDRSLHDAPTPRIGGLGILAGVAVGIALSAYQPAIPVLAALAIVIAISLFDDLGGVSPAMRFPVHLIAAGVAAFVLMADHAPWPWIVLALLAIAWLTNLYNFMDGSDGLAGGMALFGFGAYGIGAALHGDAGFAAANFAVCAAAAAFLSSTFRRRASSWATPARCRSAFSPAVFGSPAGTRSTGRCGSARSCSRRSSSTPASRWRSGSCAASASGRPTASTITSAWCTTAGATAGPRSPSMR